jgi:hypothetical protein
MRHLNDKKTHVTAEMLVQKQVFYVTNKTLTQKNVFK